MDFIVVLPCTSHGYNSIWVVVDRLTMSAHFIPISTTYRIRQYAELYMSHIIRYHGIPVIPHSEKEGTKSPYVCPGCSNHTYSNNMITRIHVQ
jgi:hypothetical protein